MKAHTDEPLTGGSRVKTRRGLLSRKRVRRCGIGAAALSIVMLLSSCMSQGEVTETRAAQLSVGDAVIAVRLSQGKFSAGLPDPPEDNWIVLLDAQGRGQATRIEAKRYGSVAFLWTDRGLSFGAPDKEYVTTDQGTQEIDVKEPSLAEDQRFSLSDGRIVVVDSGEEIRVDVIHPNGRIVTTEIPDTSGSVGQCGQHIVGITDTEDSESIRSAAFEAYAGQENNEDAVPEILTAVVQLNVPDGDAPRILAVTPVIDNVLEVHRMLACEGDVITLQSLETVKPGTPDNMTVHEFYRWVPLRWDLSTGERTYIPLTDDDGEPFEFGTKQSFYRSHSIQVGSEYRKVTWDGDAFGVDLMSGKARRLFYTEPRMPVSGGYWMTYQVDKDGVYALGESHEDHVVSLFFRPWDGKEWREIFTTDKLAGYLKEGWFSRELKVQSFAVRPGWNGGAQ